MSRINKSATNHGQMEDASNWSQLECFFQDGYCIIVVDDVQGQQNDLDTSLAPHADLATLIAVGDAGARRDDEIASSALYKPAGCFQAEATETSEQHVALTRVAEGLWYGLNLERRRLGYSRLLLVADLEQNLALVFARRHVSERFLNLITAKYGRFQRLNGTVFDSGLQQLGYHDHVLIAWLEQGVQQDTVEGDVAQEE